MERISLVVVSERVAAKGAPIGLWEPRGEDSTHRPSPQGRDKKKPAPTQWPPDEWSHFPTSHDPL